MYLSSKNFIIGGRLCKISLERMIWLFLMDACHCWKCNMQNLLERIDSARNDIELPVAVRMFALLYAAEKYDFDATNLMNFIDEI